MVKKVTPVKKAVKKKVAVKPAAAKKVVAKKAVKKVVKPVPAKAKKVVAKPAVTSKPKKSGVVKSTKKVVLKSVKTPKKIVTPVKPAKEVKKAVKATKEVAPKKVHVVEKPKVVAPVVPAPPKPKAPSKKYSKTELEHFKKIIVDKQREIIEQLQNLRDQMLDPTTGEYINENSPYSLHMAEQGTDAMEREKTYLYAQRENKFLGYLEDALKRIELGTYGLCIECIDDPKHLCPTCPLIPKERLEAVPHSQLCVQIKMKQEKPRRM